MFPRTGSPDRFQATFARICFRARVSRTGFKRTRYQARLPSKGSQAKLQGTDLQARCLGTGVQAKFLLLSRFISNSSQKSFQQTCVDFFLYCSCCCWGSSLCLFFFPQGRPQSNPFIFCSQESLSLTTGKIREKMESIKGPPTVA